VRELVGAGATFDYKSTPQIIRKYKTDQNTASGSYSTEYYLMLVPSKIDINRSYEYTPMYGVPNIYITKELEDQALPLNDRIEIVKFLLPKYRKLGISLDEMLYWALTRGEIEFADALINMGVNLNKTPPKYYSSWGNSTYITIITEGYQSNYWTSYITALSDLRSDQLLPMLKRIALLASDFGKKPVISQKMFDELKWNDESLSFALDNCDFSKVNQKKALESSVSGNRDVSLAKMAEIGWLSQAAKLDNLIAFAQENKKNDILAWLIDYKNKTVDIAAEGRKKEAQMIKELSEDPNSVSSIKKVWSYEKLSDGTLLITSYKGTETNVVIPSVIGKTAVTVIGNEAFSASSFGRKASNYEIRKKITSIIIPEGVKEIWSWAFSCCESLVTVTLPDTLKTISNYAFSSCEKLKDISIPKGIKTIDPSAFSGCDSLKDENGFAVVDGFLLGYYGYDSSLRIPDVVKYVVSLLGKYSSFNKSITEIILPEGLENIGEGAFENSTELESISIPSSVKTIGKKAFFKSGIETIELKEGLKTIGAEAFAHTPLNSVKIPQSVVKIGPQAFFSCRKLKDVYISEKTVKFGKEILGAYDSDTSLGVVKPSGVYVHTPAGSAAEEYMKQYGGVCIVNDYGEDK
jgi:hypothetical protein